MSQTAPVFSPLRVENRSLSEKKRSRVDDDSRSSEAPNPMRPRPLSWHPSAPVEPPLQSMQPRSIGVHSILNPPAKSPAFVDSGRGVTAGQSPSIPLSHPRLPSSPTVRLASPSIHHAKCPSLSPAMMNRQIITPMSPAARLVGPGGTYPRRANSLQSSLAQESRRGLYNMSPRSSPLPIDPQSTSATGNQPQAPTSVHSTPTFHSRRTSANPTPNPSSQETSPTTPVSAYGHFERSSPAIAGMAVPPSAPPFPPHSPYGTLDPVHRFPSGMAAPRHAGDEQATIGGPQPENSLLPGMIPCILDLKSGSSSQAEKRKANSDASRRFRNRKRNEMQMEQKITAQQDEIRKQAEALQKQAQEIETLIKERDHYRNERDFYREHVSRIVPPGQVSPRPTSPQAFRPQSGQDGESTWQGTDTTRKAMGATSGSAGHQTASMVESIPSTRHQGSWHTAPSSYPAKVERGIMSEEQNARLLPQVPGTWTRSS